MDFYFDRFPFLTAKQKRWFRENDIFSALLLFLSSMFEYKNMPETINTDFIEFYNLLSPMGCSGVFEHNGKLILGYCTEGGALDPYLVPTKFNINTLGIENKVGAVPGLNCAVCWNNKLHKNDLIVLNRYTEKFNLLDTCETALIKFARLFPVIETEDSRIEQELKKALKNAENAEPFTFTSKGLSKLGVDGTPGMTVQQIGDYNAVDKLQYLSTYYNDLLRRFYTMYGMSYEASFKSAQQSIEEVTSAQIASWIIPNDKLNERKKFVEKLNQTFGTNASVDYSMAWKKSYEKYMTDMNKDFSEQGGEE